MSILKLEFDLPKGIEHKKDAMEFFARETKYLIMVAEDGNTKTVVLK